ncbi:hypothetical protein TNCV_2093961 [Trichonephila clavipes]|nr:hypothetical protein TNCV_2093961 [Trichonephila clavipes]
MLQSAELLLEELRPTPTLKTTCGNRRRRRNVARELTSVEFLISTQKKVSNGSHREGVRAKRRTTQVPANRTMYPAFL